MTADSASSRSVAIATNNLECERHIQYFSTIERYFVANGWKVVTDFRADLVVVCACGFHDAMYKKVCHTLAGIRESRHPEASVVILGCLPKTHAKDLADSFRGPVIPYGQEEALDRLIGARVPFSEVQAPHVFRPQEERPAEPASKAFFHIRIAEGCLRQCTFCVINKAKGALRSTSPEEVQRQYRDGLAQGYRRIFLMAEDTFAYGLDIGTTVPELVASLLAMDSDVELHFGSLHSRWLVAYGGSLVEWCRRGVVRHLHVGLQHVNEDILSKMGRPARIEDICAVLRRIKEASPAVVLSADVIVGFHGETDEKFAELVEFMKKDTLFDSVSHFGFSDVKGAPSFEFDGKLNPLLVARRWDILKDVLGPRSYYNRTEDADDGYRKAYQATFNNDYSFCRHTFVGP